MIQAIEIAEEKGYHQGMQLRFAPAPVNTRIRFFPSEAAFARAWAKAPGTRLWDEGAPFSATLSREATHFLPGGEAGKRWSSLGEILERLAAAGHQRSRPLLVAGGGATLDLGALGASLYRRGVPLVLVPTTLLGMVDAAVGGKTAVDGEGRAGIRKNFAGTFYPAREVWIAPHFLATLPERERISGAGECWKMLWIAGAKFPEEALFRFVRDGKVSPGLGRIVKQCLAAKIHVVRKDPLDTRRLREVLNFGHTAGHALESLGGLSHGEAILWGAAVETMLLGTAGEKMQAIILDVLERLGLPLPTAFSSGADFVELLAADKKAKGAKIELSLLTAPGKVVKRAYRPVQIAAAIKAFPEFYRLASAHRRG